MIEINLNGKIMVLYQLFSSKSILQEYKIMTALSYVVLIIHSPDIQIVWLQRKKNIIGNNKHIKRLP